jgi:hypothetical protein
MTLTDPTDDQLLEAFATEVARLQTGYGGILIVEPDGKGEPVIVDHRPFPPWLTSFDAVLPFLGTLWAIYAYPYGDFEVEIAEAAWTAKAKSLPRAAVLALLAAYGVEVRWTNEKQQKA